MLYITKTKHTTGTKLKTIFTISGSILLYNTKTKHTTETKLKTITILQILKKGQ